MTIPMIRREIARLEALARQAELCTTEEECLAAAADLRDELYVLENPEEFN